MVYIPTGPDGATSGDFLILDQWNNLEGLNQFFADHNVQEGGNLIFSQRSPGGLDPGRGLCCLPLPGPLREKRPPPGRGSGAGQICDRGAEGT